VRILNAAPLVAEQLRLTRLEEFLAPAESNAQPEAAPQPVRPTPRAAVA